MSFPLPRQGARGRKVTRTRDPKPGTIVHWPRRRYRSEWQRFHAGSDGKRQPKTDLTPFCIGFTVRASVNEPVGQFSLNLLPVPRLDHDRRRGPGRLDLPATLYGKIRPGDMIMVGHDIPGGLMLGFVDDVRRETSQGPQASSTVMVRGTDFGKLLMQDAIIHPSPEVIEWESVVQQLRNVLGDDHPLVENLRGIWGPEVGPRGREANAFKAVSLADVVDFVLNAAVSTRLPFEPLGAALGGKRAGEYITPRVSTFDGAQVFNEGLNSYQGNIWGLLQTAIDPDFYEMYFQTTPVRAVPGGPWEPIPRVELVVRPKPYDEPGLDFWPTGFTLHNWKSLVASLHPTGSDWVIEREQDLGLQLGRSDADVFSYYEVVARHDLVSNDLAYNMGLYYPLIDTFQLTRYGLRAYRSQVGLVGNQYLRRVDPEDDSALLSQGEARDEVHRARGRLFNWYRLADFFESGTAIVPGNDLYRPGDPFFFPWLEPWIGEQKGLRFYCTAITWQWAHGQNYTAQLELVRGHNDGVIEAAKREIQEDKHQLNPRNFLEV